VLVLVKTKDPQDEYAPVIENETSHSWAED